MYPTKEERESRMKFIDQQIETITRMVTVGNDNLVKLMKEKRILNELGDLDETTQK